ncbi:unnamed protein product [Caenorhabditis bovis]|uniref:Uncharacterized protein n=1 Tax=Caenorhabditis bovis TaxID=2654633 RepID=A0A8S1ESF6_9PELO|nr:unnamed protein product [Caenorhabditis bovis]
MTVLLIKSILLAIMAAVSVLFGLLPIKLLRLINDPTSHFFTGRSSLLISLLSCFAGGVFVSVCFLDMLPDALDSWEEAKTNMEFDSDYPFVTLIALISFFVVYLFEETSTLICDVPHAHVNSKEHLSVVMPQRDRFATVGSIFNVDKGSAEINGGEARISRSLLFVTAFVLHVFLECFAFGVQNDIKSAMSLFIGITIHKAIVMFSIGMKLTRNHPIRWWIVMSLVVFIAFCNVLGGSIGIIIESSNMNTTDKSLTTAILMSISLGTFIFISFFEMLAPERANNHSNILQCCSAMLGFVIIAGVMCI